MKKNTLFSQLLSPGFTLTLLLIPLLCFFGFQYYHSSLRVAKAQFYQNSFQMISEFDRDYESLLAQFEKHSLPLAQKFEKKLKKISFESQAREISKDFPAYEGQYNMEWQRSYSRKLKGKLQIQLSNLQRKILKPFPDLKSGSFGINYFDLHLAMEYIHKYNEMSSSRADRTMTQLSASPEEHGPSLIARTFANLLTRRMHQKEGIDPFFLIPFESLYNLDLLKAPLSYRSMNLFNNQVWIYFTPIPARDKDREFFDVSKMVDIPPNEVFKGFLSLTCNLSSFYEITHQPTTKHEIEYRLSQLSEIKELLPASFTLLDPVNHSSLGNVDFEFLKKSVEDGQTQFKIQFTKDGHYFALLQLDSSLGKYFHFAKASRSTLLKKAYELLKLTSFFVIGLLFFYLLFGSVLTKSISYPIEKFSAIVEDCSSSLDDANLKNFQSSMKELQILQGEFQRSLSKTREQIQFLESYSRIQAATLEREESKFLEVLIAESSRFDHETDWHKFDFEELALKLKSNDIEALRAFSQQCAHFEDRKEQIRLSRELERTQREFELAESVQSSLLPDLKNFPIPVSPYFSPARYLGGDFYEGMESEDWLNLALADVSGKGLSAALFASSIKAHLLALLPSGSDPCSILRNLNLHSCALNQSGFFCTMFLCRYHPQEAILEYSSAGQNQMLLYDGETIQELSSKGLPLGLMENDFYLLEKVNIDRDSLLILYSDGVNEAENELKELYGMERFFQVIQENKDLNEVELSKAIIEDITLFRQNQEQSDDITMLIASLSPA